MTRPHTTFPRPYWTPRCCLLLAPVVFFFGIESLGLGAHATLIAMIIGAVVLDTQRARRGQQERDHHAQHLLEQAQNGRRCDTFSLYLRAFIADRTLQHSSQRDYGADESGVSNLETTIARALESTAPLVRVGGSRRLGAGQIDVDKSEWQNAVTTLCAQAKTVILVPSHREGLLWEIDLLIANDLWCKTIFVMPPTRLGNRRRIYSWWQMAQGVFRDKGIQLPDYRPNGMLFRLDRDWSIRGWTEIGKAGSKQLAHAFSRVSSLDSPHPPSKPDEFFAPSRPLYIGGRLLAAMVMIRIPLYLLAGIMFLFLFDPKTTVILPQMVVAATCVIACVSITFLIEGIPRALAAVGLSTLSLLGVPSYLVWLGDGSEWAVMPAATCFGLGLILVGAGIAIAAFTERAKNT